MHRVPPIDPVQHIGELGRRNRDCAGGHGWPDETTPFQPLGVQRHAKAIMPEDLDQIAPVTSQGDLLVRFELVWKFRLATKQSKYCGVEVRVEDYPHQTGVCLAQHTPKNFAL
jgi:hypothetical protein